MLVGLRSKTSLASVRVFDGRFDLGPGRAGELAALPRLGIRGLRRLPVAPAHELMQGEGDFVGMRCAPNNDALQLEGIVGDGADFHQLGFDGF